MTESIQKIKIINDKVKDGFNKVKTEIKSLVHTQSKTVSELDTRLEKIELFLNENKNISSDIDKIDGELTNLQKSLSEIDISEEISSVKELVLDKKVLDRHYAPSKDTNDRLSVVEDNLASTLSVLNDIKKHVKEISKVKDEVNSLKKDLKKDIDSVNKTLKTEIDSVNNDLKKDVDSMNKTFKTELDSVNNDLKKDVDSMNKDLKQNSDSMNKHIDSINNQLESEVVMKDKLKEFTSELMGEVKGKFDNLKTEIKALESKEKEDQKALSKSLQESVKLKLEKELSGLNSKLSNLVPREELDTRFDSIMKAVEIDINDFKGHLDKSKEGEKENIKSIKDVRSDFEKLEAEVSMLNMQNNNMAISLNQIDELNDTVATMDNNLTNANKNIDNMQKEISSAAWQLDLSDYAKMSDVEHKLNQLTIQNDQIDQINEQFGKLENVLKTVEFDTKKDILNFSNSLTNFITVDHLNSHLELMRNSLGDSVTDEVESRITEIQLSNEVISEREAVEKTSKRASKKTNGSLPVITKDPDRTEPSSDIFNDEITKDKTETEVKKPKPFWDKVVDFFVEEEDEDENLNEKK